MHCVRKESLAIAQNIAISAAIASHIDTSAVPVATSHTTKNTKAKAQKTILSVAIVI